MTNLIQNNIQCTSKESPEVFYNAMEASQTLEKGYIDVIPGVKNASINLDKLTVGTGMVQQDLRDCAWNPSEGPSLGSKNVTIADLKVNAEQCIDALDCLFAQEKYKATKRGEMAPEFQDLLLARLGKGVGLDIERLIWSGDTMSGDPVDGIYTEGSQDMNTIKVQGTTINASNVLAEAEKVYAAIPQAVLDEQFVNGEDAAVSVFMAPTDYRYLRQALSTTPTDVNVTLPSWTVDNGEIAYMGIKFRAVAGLQTGKMVAGAKYNFKFVTNLLEDAVLNAARGASLKDENVLYIKAQFRAKATYVNSDEVVIYG